MSLSQATSSQNIRPPADFGELSNRQLIGNFGSGLIAPFDAEDGSFVSFLKQSPGAAMRINGLWGLGFGDDAGAGPSAITGYSGPSRLNEM